ANYTIDVQSDLVKDLYGNAVLTGAIGSFTVKIPQIFMVSNADDSGPGSLRDAMTKAFNSPTADIITFAPGIFGSAQTIFLSSSLPQITGQLSIIGPGASLLTVEPDPDGLASFRLLNSSAGVLNISGITFTGGQSNGHS